MVKKSSVFTSILLGVAGGAAAAVFLASKTGKSVKEKVVKFANDYKENHDQINADLVHKAQDFGKQAVNKYGEVKEQLESGELTVDEMIQSGKEKVQTVKEHSLEKFEQIKEKIAESNLTTEDLLASIKEKAASFTQSDLEVDEEETEVSEVIEIDLVESPLTEAPAEQSPISEEETDATAKEEQ